MHRRLPQLEQIIAASQSICIGYSGGVDSAFLAITALDVLGANNVLAVTGRSASYPDVQWGAARSIAREFGLPHREVETDELTDSRYLANPNNRCYFCKTELWTKVVTIAHQENLLTVADGTNADDVSGHRPGARAAREHGIRSPLLEAGLTKSDIRALSRARGLPSWNQPSAPCLSSRVAYGLAITPERLHQVEAAEAVVREFGIREFRVRHHGSLARLEIAVDEIRTAIDAAAVLAARIKALGFSRVLLDVEGYRQGSLNQGRLVQLADRAAATPFNVTAEADDIAILDAPFSALQQIRAVCAKLRQAGFRFITVDLDQARTTSRPYA